MLFRKCKHIKIKNRLTAARRWITGRGQALFLFCLETIFAKVENN
jgi:hypothetical protein